MKRNYLLQIFFVLALQFFNAQTITFVSEKNNKPLPKVSVFGKDGSILAYSDIDGKIEKSLIKPDQEKFQLVYDNFSVATLSYSDFDKDVIKINDRIKDIETVVIKNNKPAKYIFIKGNFNTYVTVNNKLNGYVDGIVTYIFDNSTKKLKSTNVQQYRVYRLKDPKNDKKQMSSWDYGNSLNLPKLKHLGNPEDYKTRMTEIKELKGDRKDEIEISGGMLLEKEFAFLGYRFYELRTILNLSFEKGSAKTLKDFLEYNELAFMKIKHKSEPSPNQISVYSNFYPTEFSFENNNDVEKVKYNKDNSNYQTKFWEDPSFPNMQTIFSSFFKDDLKEQENKK
ncbi:hypothetical protein SAMN05421664_1447 [Chryseobacterium soldanellicola]|uniref:Uncharacterized protein n=1 Tax=Chryseobacterium soldanellicola TaxID=311333 RepID=A0A1H1AKH5_9FLAO|nr:hypothetical protein [Chryseobacterium soldanellicola]SDQ39696.1 hypothetical protein SAMN05421664_1447 [Chryseobacterium soldanellicola]